MVDSTIHSPSVQVFPTALGTFHMWICCKDDRGMEDSYQLRPGSYFTDPEHGLLQSFSIIVDKVGGRSHEVTFDDEQGKWHCTCPGFQNHGMKCNNGKGCRHIRFIVALQQIVSPAL